MKVEQHIVYMRISQKVKELFF